MLRNISSPKCKKVNNNYHPPTCTRHISVFSARWLFVVLPYRDSVTMFDSSVEVLSPDSCALGVSVW